MRFGGGDLVGAGTERERDEERLLRRGDAFEACLQPLVHDPLVRGVHVDDDEPVRVLGQDEGAGDLGDRTSFAPMRRGSIASASSPGA